MKKLLLLILIAPFLSFAQEGGMKFEHTLSWKEVQAKAKAENKYIFMDCLTTWCGPCKFMSATIFPEKEVGDFYNPKFVNVKVQLDTIAADADDIKKWYQDAHDIATKYDVHIYPTYLIFDPNGNLVHRFVGSSDDKTFLARGANSLDPNKQYYPLLAKYDAGERSLAFLKNFAVVSQEAYDLANASLASIQYLDGQKDLYTKENIEFIDKFTRSSKDKGFAMMLNNADKMDAVMGKGKAEEKVMNIVLQEEVNPILRKKDAIDWQAYSASLTQKYPSLADEVFAKTKVVYYQVKNDWNNFATEVVAYMNKYGSKASAGDMNSYAWAVFENCKDMTCVTQALDWSKRSFAEKENGMFMDTYANILYKMGKKTEAIEWEKKALAIVPDAEKKTYQETLDKMEKGEKTWKD